MKSMLVLMVHTSDVQCLNPGFPLDFFNDFIQYVQSPAEVLYKNSAKLAPKRVNSNYQSHGKGL